MRVPIRVGSLAVVAMLVLGASQSAVAVETNFERDDAQPVQETGSNAEQRAVERFDGAEGGEPREGSEADDVESRENTGANEDTSSPENVEDTGAGSGSGNDSSLEVVDDAKNLVVSDEMDVGDTAPTELAVVGELVEVPSEPTAESLKKQEERRKNKGPRKKTRQVPIEEERFELAPEFQPEFELEQDEVLDENLFEMVPGWVSLVTDDGQRLRLDENSLNAELEPGDRIAAKLELPAEAQEAVQEVMDEAAGESVKSSELVQAAATAIALSGQPVALVGEQVLPTPAPMSTALAVKPHSVDVVFFTTNKASQETKLRALVTTVSNYWKKESEGKINGITVNAVKQVAPPANLNVCDPNAAEIAAKAMFPNSNYLEGAPVVPRPSRKST